MSNRILLAFLFVGSVVLASTDPDESVNTPVATFTVSLPASNELLETPVSLELASITGIDTNQLQLRKINGDKSEPVPFQISKDTFPVMSWMIDENDQDLESIQYALVRLSKPAGVITRSRAIDDGTTLTLMSGDRSFLTYQHVTMLPPKGIDNAYQRSAFIHPLYAPHGQVLTRIQPKDHYHHYGIWNPWTHVSFEGKIVDFWNLNGKQGTVRFAGFESISEGPVFSEFKAKHEHVVFEENGNEKVALNEIQSVRIYFTDKDYYVADFTIELRCATDSPFTILEHRYAGFSWRTTEAWNNQNSEVITSEGRTRREADGSNARWCITQGEIDGDYAGVVLMSSPENYNHPEPLRVWPIDMHERGDLFVNFAPTKNMDWPLVPGETYTLKYRMLVYNDHFTPEKAETAWQSFAHAPKIEVEWIEPE